jgi:integrase/recombinase XerD
MERKLISVEEIGRMINSKMDIMDKVIITHLAKTGIRRNELISLEVSDEDLVEQKIRLKPTTSKPPERYSLTITRPSSLLRWLRVEEGMNQHKETSLFPSAWVFRISGNEVFLPVVNASGAYGLHDTVPRDWRNILSQRCARHWNLSPQGGPTISRAVSASFIVVLSGMTIYRG